MAKKVLKPMSEAHKQKLRDAYWTRQAAKRKGIHLPTVKEKREAARAKKVPVTEQSVIQLIEDTPVKEEDRVNNPVVTRYESSHGIKHPLRYRVPHA